MSGLVEILSYIFGTGGILGFASYFLFFKANKRIKNAEAQEKDLENLNSVIKILKEQVEYLNEELNRLKSRIGEKDGLITNLYRERDILEKKYSQKKSAINCAYTCDKKDCPVLIKLKELEDNG